MMAAPWWWHAARKDTLALASTWIWSAIAVVAALTMLGPAAGIVAYLMGSTMLGALIVGHEFSNRTLPGLLTVPVSRRHLLAVKYVVLGLMLVALAVLAWLSGISRSEPDSRLTAVLVSKFGLRGQMALLLPPLCGFCLAPWLTMMTRSPLAGAVFAGGAVCTLSVFGELLATLSVIASGYRAELRALESLFPVRATIALCATGALSTWIVIGRLQAHDGGAAVLEGPRWVRRSRSVDAGLAVLPARRHHWIRSLVVKELHLHSLLLVITLLYVAAWYVLATTQPHLHWRYRLPLSFLTVCYGAVAAILAGAFASAEERQLGTSHWQQLFPLPAWQQWAIKTVVLLALVVALGVGLPLFLQSITPMLIRADDTMPDAQWALVSTLALGSLYVSSLSTSGLRATVASIGLIFVVSPVAFALDALARSIAWSVESRLANADWPRRIGPAVWYSMGPWVAGLAVAVFALVVMRFAMLNHRAADRGVGLIWRQGFKLAVIAVAFMTCGGVFEAAARRSWRFGDDNGARLSGRVIYEGTAPKPTVAEMPGLSLESATLKHLAATIDSTNGNTFAMSYTRTGPYFIRVGLLPFRSPWTLKSVSREGLDFTNAPIDLERDLDGVVITFTDHAGSIKGNVGDTNGIRAGVLVFIFPVDSRLWKWATARPQGDWQVRGVVTSTSGDYSLHMPPDGDYFLIATPGTHLGRLGYPGFGLLLDGEVRVYQDPSAVLARFAPVAERITARHGETITKNLVVKRP